MASTIHDAAIQHWAGKALSLSNERWLKRALGAARNRDRSNPSGSRILSAYLRDHGNALVDQLDGLPDAEMIAPNFPKRPGMLDVLGYLADFAAIAAIVFVGELCLPITLYVMTWLMLVWEIEKRSKPRKAEPEDDGFGGLIDPPEGK